MEEVIVSLYQHSIMEIKVRCIFYGIHLFLLYILEKLY